AVVIHLEGGDARRDGEVVRVCLGHVDVVAAVAIAGQRPVCCPRPLCEAKEGEHCEQQPPRGPAP
ncbi:MAG: hypothetical protein K5854_10095, partial [Prevotella sp.]|nr:hypothetical protein [Prevotella sp.]